MNYFWPEHYIEIASQLQAPATLWLVTSLLCHSIAIWLCLTSYQRMSNSHQYWFVQHFSKWARFPEAQKTINQGDETLDVIASGLTDSQNLPPGTQCWTLRSTFLSLWYLIFLLRFTLVTVAMVPASACSERKVQWIPQYHWSTPSHSRTAPGGPSRLPSAAEPLAWKFTLPYHIRVYRTLLTTLSRFGRRQRRPSVPCLRYWLLRAQSCAACEICKEGRGTEAALSPCT